MLFDQNIKTPNHQFIRLSDGTEVRAFPDGSGLEIAPPRRLFSTAVLDPNDAIRLAAWLNRFFTENHQGEVRAEADRVKANRAAKAKRYEDKRAIPK